MSHYFTNDEIKSNEKIYVTKINDIELKFYTDNGVFSKNKLDIHKNKSSIFSNILSVFLII